MKKFNSLRTAAKEPSLPPSVQIVYGRNASQTNLSVDPEYHYVRQTAVNMANDYLRSMSDYGMKEPSRDAQRLLNIHHDGNRWTHDAARSRLANRRTLADYLKLPVVSNHVQSSSNRSKNLLVYHYYANPVADMGKDERGRTIRPGIYDLGDKSYFAHPFQTQNLVKFARDMASNAIVRSGSTDPDDWERAMAPIAHLAHGKKLEDGSYESISQGHKPRFLHTEADNVLKIIANNVHIDKSSDRNSLKKHQRALEDMKTIKTSMCFCPNCAIDQWIHGSNTIFDVQHDYAARNSSDPLLRALHEKHYPGSENIPGSVAHFGDRAELAPHRAYLRTPEAMQHLTHLQQRRIDERDKTFAPLDDDLDRAMTEYEKDSNIPGRGLDLYTNIVKPSWMEED